MKIKRAVSLFICLLILGSLNLQGQQSFLLKKDIVVAEGESQENILTFGGSILVEGKVREDVIAFGGSIVIKGEVSGAVIGIGSSITLGPNAVVKKDVCSIGGELNKEPGSVVEGDTIYFKTTEDISRFLRETFKGIFSFSFVPIILLIQLLTFFIWFILSIGLTALFPRQITFASSQIRKSFWPIFGFGCLAIIIYAGAVIFSAILSFLLIGIPLLLFLVILGIAVQIFGRVALFYFIGESFLKAFGKKKASLFLAVMPGLVLATIIRFTPGIGFLFSLGMSVVGWGVVLKTKFGTTENWFRRKPG